MLKVECLESAKVVNSCNSVVSVFSDMFGNIVTIQKNVLILCPAGLQSLTFHLSPVCSIAVHIIVTQCMDFITNGADVYKYAALGAYRYHKYCSILVIKVSPLLHDRPSEQKVDFFLAAVQQSGGKGELQLPLTHACPPFFVLRLLMQTWKSSESGGRCCEKGEQSVDCFRAASLLNCGCRSEF